MGLFGSLESYFLSSLYTLDISFLSDVKLVQIFSNPTSDRRLISNIYKELKKLDSREPNNPIKKWGTELNKEFSTEEY